MIAMTSPSNAPGCAPATAVRRPAPVLETYLECPVCAFEPAGRLLAPRWACPKCHASCWRRAVRLAGNVRPTEARGTRSGR